MHDGGMPEVSVDHGPARRLSWTSVQLTAAPQLEDPAAPSCASSTVPVTPVSPPPSLSEAIASTSGGGTALKRSSSVLRRGPQSGDSQDLLCEPAPELTVAAAVEPEPPPPPPPPPPPTASDSLAARLQADVDDSGEVTVLGVALVANCHVSLVIFGLFFLAAGTLLCVISFRAPTTTTGDVQSRVAGTFFLCLAAVMCTFGLCLCRLDHQMSRRDQEKGVADCGNCYIHEDSSRCHRVLPSIQRARRSTQRAKRHMLRQLDEHWMSAAAGKHREKTFSSIELLASASTESVGCGRCNEAASYGTIEKTDVASFPS